MIIFFGLAMGEESWRWGLWETQRKGTIPGQSTFDSLSGFP